MVVNKKLKSKRMKTIKINTRDKGLSFNITIKGPTNKMKGICCCGTGNSLNGYQK